MLGRNAISAADHRRAQRRYAALVAQHDPSDGAFWQTALHNQIYLGDEIFVEKMQAQASLPSKSASEIPKAQRKQRISWKECLNACRGERDLALTMAYRDQGMTMTWLAQQCGLSVSHVSRLVAGVERIERGDINEK